MSPNVHTNNHTARNNFKTEAHAKQHTSCVFLSKSRILLARLLGTTTLTQRTVACDVSRFQGSFPSHVPNLTQGLARAKLAMLLC